MGNGTGTTPTGAGNGFTFAVIESLTITAHKTSVGLSKVFFLTSATMGVSSFSWAAPLLLLCLAVRWICDDATGSISGDWSCRAAGGSERNKGPNTNIVGGVPAAAGRYPFFGLTDTRVVCGAVVIWPDLMATAAHCQGAFRNVNMFIGTTVNT